MVPIPAIRTRQDWLRLTGPVPPSARITRLIQHNTQDDVISTTMHRKNHELSRTASMVVAAMT
jgi:hypothetical protein